MAEKLRKFRFEYTILNTKNIIHFPKHHTKNQIHQTKCAFDYPKYIIHHTTDQINTIQNIRLFAATLKST